MSNLPLPCHLILLFLLFSVIVIDIRINTVLFYFVVGNAR